MHVLIADFSSNLQGHHRDVLRGSHYWVEASEPERLYPVFHGSRSRGNESFLGFLQDLVNAMLPVQYHLMLS
jgi:hypothetical protein